MHRWRSEYDCLVELEKHVPQINPKSMYVMTTADDHKIPYRRLEGSLWPQIKPTFLDWHKTKEADFATGNWILKEVSEATKMQFSLEDMTGQISRLRNDVRDIASKIEYELGEARRERETERRVFNTQVKDRGELK